MFNGSRCSYSVQNLQRTSLNFKKERAQFSNSSGNMFLRSEDTKQNQQKEKAHGAKSRENQVHDSKSRFLGESHRMCLSPPATSGENTWGVLSTREAHWRLIM